MSDVTILATGLGFPEGPVVCPDGSVILTEIRNNQLSKVTPNGKTSVFSRCGGGPNGLAYGPDGALYLCNNGGSKYVEGYSMGVAPHPDYKFGYIQRIDPKIGEARTLYAEVGGNKLSAPMRELEDDELETKLREAKEELFNLRFQKSYGQLEDPNALRRAKRDVARILTVLRERQLASGGE